ncbi:MAG: hypothetical protein AAF215_27260 [Cyanobacteria bacterium P01_A01_bin.123]
MIDEPFKVGIIGHCNLGSVEKHSYIHFYCHRLLAELKQKYSDMIAISAIADGADSIFAQCAVSLGIRLESIIPFKKFDSDFQEDTTYERYKSLRRKSKYETRVNFSERSNLAYKRSMEWLVFKSNMILAVWDGREEGTIGGTWEAVSLSRRIRKKMIHINNKSRKINYYFCKGNEYELRKELSLEQVIKHL